MAVSTSSRLAGGRSAKAPPWVATQWHPHRRDRRDGLLLGGEIVGQATVDVIRTPPSTAPGPSSSLGIRRSTKASRMWRWIGSRALAGVAVWAEAFRAARGTNATDAINALREMAWSSSGFSMGFMTLLTWGIIHPYDILGWHGEVAEWSNAAVSKTVEPSRVSRVRIPPSPPSIQSLRIEIFVTVLVLHRQGI